MIEFYHHAKADGRPVPKILGLTASPVARSSLKSMETLEQSLDAVCKSPTMHREELLTHVKRPSMHSISYQLSPSIGTRSLQRLRDALQGLDIMKDPTIKRLQADKTDVGRLRLKEALEKPTKIQTKMQTFCRRSTEICHELGPWAADYYIHEVVRRFTDRKSLEVDVFDLKWRDEEKRLLCHSSARCWRRGDFAAYNTRHDRHLSQSQRSAPYPHIARRRSHRDCLCQREGCCCSCLTHALRPSTPRRQISSCLHGRDLVISSETRCSGPLAG